MTSTETNPEGTDEGRDAPPAPERTTEPTSRIELTCPRCETRFSTYQATCPTCGFDLADAYCATQRLRPSRLTKTIALVVLLVGALTCAAAVVWRLWFG